MAKLNMSVPHSLPKEEALTRIKSLFTNLKEQQKDVVSDVNENWSGDQGEFAFSAKGFDLSGNIMVTDNSIDIDADVPFAVSLFSGRIKSIIEERARDLLDK